MFDQNDVDQSFSMRPLFHYHQRITQVIIQAHGPIFAWLRDCEHIYELKSLNDLLIFCHWKLALCYVINV